jgi:hypothetical protein
MPLQKKRWRGVRRGTVLIVGQDAGRVERNVDIRTGPGGKRSAGVNMAGLPCGLYYVQLDNVSRNRRSATRAWYASATGVTRLILLGPNPPLGGGRID